MESSVSVSNYPKNSDDSVNVRWIFYNPVPDF